MIDDKSCLYLFWPPNIGLKKVRAAMYIGDVYSGMHEDVYSGMHEDVYSGMHEDVYSGMHEKVIRQVGWVVNPTNPQAV
jgi:hypothetical protein